MSLNHNYYEPIFSHIYVEEAVFDLEIVKNIISSFKHVKVIPIRHYKDVFNKNSQNSLTQKEAIKLILAAKPDNFIYPGAKVCQSFGNANFYYASSAMNCIFDCEYCYLKGFYPSSNVVIFVNEDDMFNELTDILKNGPAYISISYDTDLLPFEPLTHHIRHWMEFVDEHKDLTIEIRTKSSNGKILSEISKGIKNLDRVIIAFSMSPKGIAEAYEKRTPSLMARIECAMVAKKAGYPIRIAFDPMIYESNWKDHYKGLIATLDRYLDLKSLKDVSVGSFRIPKDYLKRMRKRDPSSVIAQFPYELDDGVYHYSDELMEEMESMMVRELERYIPSEKIFLWKDK
ncbi:MAG: radical SAM protein [Lachnospiraceae bacterium]|nr:radical SAM protein [Lachnospiraceae bacterium]